VGLGVPLFNGEYILSESTSCIIRKILLRAFSTCLARYEIYKASTKELYTFKMIRKQM
jgi:hypothetical protein